ncbi:MAG: hypothetical protein E6936_10050 [Clostridium perfringens]|uniref:hypothetical protein n=1 Tax=Clostridium perfringens TaxID=1502 RepID=UPI0028FE787C|nr:hypothetical protein [Clostridium perfringens]MDU1307791.1 hypothetical protein [Clostridium perfringens]
MKSKNLKRFFKAIIVFIGLTLIIIVLMWIGVRVRYELLNNGFVESNINKFISGYFTLAALIGTILTLGYTWQSSKEKNLIEVVTKNRADWVKEMKVLFSDYFTKYDELKDNKNNINTNLDEGTTVKERTLTQIRNEISLRLNPNGVIDNEILSDLNNLILESKKTSNNKAETKKVKRNKKSKSDSIKGKKLSLREKVEKKIKIYLKCEWERIKFETKEGLKEYDFEYEFKKIQLINYFNYEEITVKELNNILIEIKLNQKSLLKKIYPQKTLSDEDINKQILKKIKKDKLSRKQVIQIITRIEEV